MGTARKIDSHISPSRDGRDGSAQEMTGGAAVGAASLCKSMEAIRAVRIGIDELDVRVDVMRAEADARAEDAGDEKSRKAGTAVRNGATAAMSACLSLCSCDLDLRQ